MKINIGPIESSFCIPLLCGFLFCSFSLTAWAHKDPNANVPSFRAYKTDAPITVDGVLDEPFWREAEVTSNFIDIRTGQPAEQQTTARVAYTKTHLYIAVECFDDNIEEIHASERREDREFVGDDWVEVHFDPTHTHRSKYAFFSNPLGTKADASEGPSGVFNRGWTAEWELEAKIYEDRWVFEMSIPFSILNYYRKDGQTWGFNFTRMLRRTDTTSFWSYNETNYYKPRYFGHLTGLDLADSVFDRNLEITPYVSTRMDFDGDTDTFFQTGVDANFRLTPAITTAWTINPDFGQVEADDDTIELRDTERFLPEKRLFFREGEELLNMRDRLYYSRRFTNIETGAKVSGDYEGYKFAFFNIHGDTTHDDTRYGNNSIFRVLQNVGEKSSVGYYISESEFTDGHSRVASMDGELFLNDDVRLHFQGSAADDRQRPGPAPDDFGKDSLDFLGHTSIEYDKYPWGFSLGYRGITDEFNPTLGYIPRRNIFGPEFEVHYNPRSDDKWYKSIYTSFESELYEDDSGATILRDFAYYSRVVFQNNFGFTMGHSEDYHAPYDNRRSLAGILINESDYWKSMDITWARGEFEETEYDEYIVGKRINPFERLPIRYEFVIRFEDLPTDEDETVWLNRVVFDYYFTDKMWLKTSLQHKNDSLHNISVIYGWEFIHNAHWYLVFNSVDDGDESGNSVFTKVAYTF